MISSTLKCYSSLFINRVIQKATINVMERKALDDLSNYNIVKIRQMYKLDAKKYLDNIVKKLRNEQKKYGIYTRYLYC